MHADQIVLVLLLAALLGFLIRRPGA